MGKRKRVLVIDDDTVFCLFVRRKLNDTGEFEVLVATNGAHGIELARTQSPDIILIDLVIPDIPGDRIAAQLKNFPETSDIPTIFMTALAGEEDTSVNILQQMGESYLLSKPVRAEMLAMTIKDVLEME